ncbi:hypothetical protein ANCCAN_17888, partial [Ancylostoma caninum]
LTVGCCWCSAPRCCQSNTSRGCKIFFARAVQRKIYYVCEKSGSCRMTSGTFIITLLHYYRKYSTVCVFEAKGRNVGLVGSSDVSKLECVLKRLEN